ncbi:hypothetical protein [Spirilliplanes yamanashiensis]|uniref:Uncharacterized protein n=1 Tax=Spirilliplanes yamanashiensis TaxID=42233 RepID=A0A8J4DKP0_9ACTN|nr:hypothetical protein [Spirilliplanes yamanashiensis]MDP9817703.1 hypothetical protein [Spirilliplanes yamanashiensis]GIJ04513.1 hypothetical protein Sya03_38650 [Spirilliplanes yamanashiensis]
MPRTTAAARCLLAALLGAGVAVALPAAAAQAAPGFDVQITESPGRFVAGAGPSTVTAVASTDRGGGCQKVRWSLVLRVAGVALDQVRVDRIEEDGSFPLAVQSGGDTARLTDRALDPGELCRGSTVTARYQVSFDSAATDGEVTLQAEAYSRNARLLEQSAVTRDVVGEGDPSPSPEPEESGEPGDEPSDEPEEDAAAEPDPTASAPGGLAAVQTSNGSRSTNLLGVGLIVGAVLIFIGVGILMRMQLKRRRQPEAPWHPAL